MLEIFIIASSNKLEREIWRMFFAPAAMGQALLP
jgi:hypothetical protein